MGVFNASMWQRMKLLPQLSDSIFVTATINAREKQEVMTIDIPGAFLHATNEDYVIMRMNRTLAELMAKTDPKLY